MGKKKKERLTAERQLELMLETTKLASVYQKDPDVEAINDGHPLERRVKLDRKKRKKKEKKEKKMRKNGLGIFTVQDEHTYTKGSDILPDTKSGRKLDKALGKMMEQMDATYPEDPKNEAYADAIAAAVFSHDVLVPEQSVYMHDANTVSLVTLDLIAGTLQVRNLDGEVVLCVPNHMKSQVLVEMLSEVITLAFSTPNISEANNNPVHIDSSVPEPKFRTEEDDKEVAQVTPTVSSEPESKEETEEDESDTDHESSKPLTSKLPIPKELLSGNNSEESNDTKKSQASDLSQRLSEAMDQDKFKNDIVSPAGKGRKILINPILPEDN